MTFPPLSPDRMFITILRFEDAPPELQDMSPHGGDEDWVMIVPIGHLQQGTPDVLDTTTLLIERLQALIGPCNTSCHEVPGGYIYIGAHS